MSDFSRAYRTECKSISISKCLFFLGSFFQNNINLAVCTRNFCPRLHNNTSLSRAYRDVVGFRHHSMNKVFTSSRIEHIKSLTIQYRLVRKCKVAHVCARFQVHLDDVDGESSFQGSFVIQFGVKLIHFDFRTSQKWL